MLTATALVLMMAIPGLALFYGGMVRKLNLLTIAMQCFAITCVVTITWVVAGYSLAFKGDGMLIGSLERFFLSGVTLTTVHSLAATIPESVFIVFQMTFAIVTTILIVGAFADRMKFGAMLLFAVLWSLLVYVPVAHWVWGGGFIGGWGAFDFAGGTVVHINSGVAGLVAAIVIGKRMGVGKVDMAPHNLMYTLIGASLLWVGWFGFNAGSAVAASGKAGWAMLVTQFATAAAALAWLAAEWLVKGKPSVLGILSGAIAGLVAITPAAGFVGIGGSLVIGLASGVACFFACASLKKMLGYDDALDVFGVHGVGGILGAVLTGVFALTSVVDMTDATTKQAIPGGLIDGNAAQVWTQIKAVAVVCVFSAVATFVILKVIDLIIGLRVSEEIERDGLDLNLHGETVH
ncbi:MAG: ammonium transporter [Alphaproteobacteria bacterium]|nr:ammonium transporter [Alphaproteobacteria bacterium]